MSSSNESVAIEIFGRSYTLRTEKSKEYVQNLARIVHDKMMVVEKNTNTVDSVRVAVLAALNLADEYVTTKANYERRIEALESEKNRLKELIQGALTEERIHSLPDA